MTGKGDITVVIVAGNTSGPPRQQLQFVEDIGVARAKYPKVAHVVSFTDRPISTPGTYNIHPAIGGQ